MMKKTIRITAPKGSTVARGDAKAVAARLLSLSPSDITCISEEPKSTSFLVQVDAPLFDSDLRVFRLRDGVWKASDVKCPPPSKESEKKLVVSILIVRQGELRRRILGLPPTKIWLDKPICGGRVSIGTTMCTAEAKHYILHRDASLVPSVLDTGSSICILEVDVQRLKEELGLPKSVELRSQGRDSINFTAGFLTKEDANAYRESRSRDLVPRVEVYAAWRLFKFSARVQGGGPAIVAAIRRFSHGSEVEIYARPTPGAGTNTHIIVTFSNFLQKSQQPEVAEALTEAQTALGCCASAHDVVLEAARAWITSKGNPCTVKCHG